TRRAAPPSGLRFSHRVPQHAVSPVVAPSSHPQEPDQCRQPKRGLVAFRTQCDIAATRLPARPFELSGSASQSTAPSARTEAGFIQAPLRGRAPDVLGKRCSRAGGKPLALSAKRGQNEALNVTSEDMRTAHRSASSANQRGSQLIRFSSIKGPSAMQNLAKLIRIEPAFDDPDMIRALFKRHAPYRTIAEYIPRKPEQPAFPYFRGNWAIGGEPLVDWAETIVRN